MRQQLQQKLGNLSKMLSAVASCLKRRTWKVARPQLAAAADGCQTRQDDTWMLHSPTAAHDRYACALPPYSTCRCALQNAFHSLLEGCQLCCFVAAVHGQARVAIVSQKCQFKRSCKVCFNSLRASRMSTDSRQGRGSQGGEQVQRAAK